MKSSVEDYIRLYHPLREIKEKHDEQSSYGIFVHTNFEFITTLCQKRRKEHWNLLPGASIIFMVVQE